MTPPESNKEQKDTKFWWTYPPFYKPYVEGIDEGEHNIPAIVENQHRLSVQACMEVVKKQSGKTFIHFSEEYTEGYENALKDARSALSEMKEKK